MYQVKLYGKYYKLFKGNGGIPCKITIVAINNNIVTFVRGHHSKEELENMSLLLENKCNVEKIITAITPKQKSVIDEKDREFQKMIDRADKVLEVFKNGI